MSRSSTIPRGTLFHHIGCVVAAVECLPRKELFESGEKARRSRRRLRGGRVVDLGCGHGLLAMILLILDDSSPYALAVDTRIPENSGRLLSAVEAACARLVGEAYDATVGGCTIPCSSALNICTRPKPARSLTLAGLPAGHPRRLHGRATVYVLLHCSHLGELASFPTTCP